MKDTSSNIFLDKRQISFGVLQKETDIIQTYASLMKGIRKGFIPLDDLNNFTEYTGTWNLVHELYSFLRHNKVEKFILTKNLEEDFRKRVELIITIMGRYENPKEELTFEELQKAIGIIQEIVSKSGYHDDTFKQNEGTLDEEEN